MFSIADKSSHGVYSLLITEIKSNCSDKSDDKTMVLKCGSRPRVVPGKLVRNVNSCASPQLC
jgi:hypothetical protein